MRVTKHAAKLQPVTDTPVEADLRHPDERNSSSSTSGSVREKGVTTLISARVSAVILAAGTSSRMGKAKQLLSLGESTVLAQTLAHVQAAALHEIVLVLGASAEAIRRQLPSPQELKIVVNQAYQQGIASSLRAGLSAVDPNSDAALIILGDQPFIRPQTLARIVEEYRRSQAQIVIPLHQGQRGNPVLLDRSVFSEVMALEGDVGSRAIFANHLDGIAKVEVEDKGILLDLDEPADYERLKTRV